MIHSFRFGWLALPLVLGAWTQAPEPQTRLGDEITNKIGMKLVAIAPGKFLMGSTPEEIARVQGEGRNNGYDNEAPRHEIEVSKKFYIGVYPVTQGQYCGVVGTNPSWFSATGGGKDEVAGLDTDGFPVETVSWQDAKDFCDKLSKTEGKIYRLPTEAEWELACRAGSRSQFHNGDGAEALQKTGWYRDNSGGRTHRVGQLAPSAWGLFDMHGNVCQWCEDWFEADYYAHSPAKDPQGARIGECRSLRGGSYLSVPASCRCAARAYGRHDNRDNDCGFRVVMVP